jgi:hypothetical protein
VVLDLADRVVLDRVAQDLAAPALVGLVVTDRVVPDPVGQAGLVTMDLAVPVGRAGPECMAPVGQADLVVPVTTDLVVPAVPGTATTSAVTSTELRGAMDLHPGVPASRHIPTGADHFLPRADAGGVDRSTTTATTKTRCGTPGSTSGASTSSESGSRCKESTLRDARFADRRSGRCSSRSNSVKTPASLNHPS